MPGWWPGPASLLSTGTSLQRNLLLKLLGRQRSRASRGAQVGGAALCAGTQRAVQHLSFPNVHLSGARTRMLSQFTTALLGSFGQAE